MRILWVVATLALVACQGTKSPAGGPASTVPEMPAAETHTAADPKGYPPLSEVPEGKAVATFAGGCFWCMETAFEEIPGVLDVQSGFTGGSAERPSYKAVGSGGTGHAEAVRVVFDPKQISYDKLLEQYWYNVDPTTVDRQFCDRGSEYRPTIFVHDDAQRKAAEASKPLVAKHKKFEGELKPPIEQAGAFFPAENYHQDFYKKDPVRYISYRTGCRRDARLKELWGEKAGGPFPSAH